MFDVVSGSRPRASQADLGNLLHWAGRIEDIQRHIDRVAPRVVASIQNGFVEAGEFTATLEEPVRLNGVTYRILKIDGRRCHIAIDGGLESIERAFCAIRGA